MLPLVIAAALVFAIIATFLFDIDTLSLASFSLFEGPFGDVLSIEPTFSAALLFASLAFSFVLVYLASVRVASKRGALAAIAIVFVSAPVMLAVRSISLGFLAAPLLMLVVYQLSTRKYRLWSIAVPIAALFLLDYAIYPLFVLFSLLLTSPLRSDPDPRLGELFLVVLVAFVAFASWPSSSFSVDGMLGLGLVFVALSVYGVYRVLARGEERVHPFVALALASAVLLLLGDPFGALALILSAAVLIAVSFESIFAFFDVSNIRFKRAVSFGLFLIALSLTFTQSAFVVSAVDHMTPELASSLASFDGRVAIDERLAPALAFYSDAEPVPLSSEEVRVLSNASFIVQVIELIDGRFGSFALDRAPSYADDGCFSVVERGVLVEVAVRCDLA